VRHAWIFACSIAAIAAACDEKFPQQLEPAPPPPLVDAGSDADSNDGAVTPKGARTLGIEVQIDALDFPDQVRAIIDAGARTTNASFAWTEIERPIDGGDAADGSAEASADAEAGTQISNAGVHIVNLILGTSDVRAIFAVPALDGSGPRLPPDLAGKTLDDPAVATRYDAVTDYVFSQMPDLELDAYLVAVDADATLGADAAKWAAFTTFVSKAAIHARAKRPALKVGFAMSAAALVDKKDLVAGALAASDVVVVSQPVSFDALTDAAPSGKPIFVHRIGLDAGDAFRQWDRHGDRIPIVMFPAVSADVVREARVRGF
jgi:hypothetical protein